MFDCCQLISGFSAIYKASEIKYLRIHIINKKKCYKKHIEESIKKGNNHSYNVPSIVVKSSNKVMIGKSFWKGAALQSITHGSDVTYYTKEQLNKIQVTENQVYRYLLGAPKHTPICTFRGEIGASSIIIRDMKTKLLII